jgi:hypothetical protein
MRSAEGFVVLKSFLLIFSDLIFDSKVDPGRPSLAAAPDGLDICPPLSLRAASIILFLLGRKLSWPGRGLLQEPSQEKSNLASWRE